MDIWLFQLYCIVLNSSQSLGSIGPLIDISQILNTLFMINLNLPIITQTLYEKMNMISNINLKFSITTPLMLLKGVNPFKYPNTTTSYANLGFETYSFIYNVQGQLVSTIQITVIFLIIRKLNAVLVSKRKWAYFSDKITTFLNDSKYMFHEIYYTQRLYIYFCFFQFVDQFKFSHYSKLIYSFLVLELITLALFFFVETSMLKKWYERIYIMENISNEAYLSILAELKGRTINSKNGMQECQILLLFLQTFIHLVLTLSHCKWNQIIICTLVFLGMSIQIIVRVGFKNSSR